MEDDRSEYVSSSSEPWNVAKGFSFFHVLIPLVEARKLVKVAMFGSELSEPFPLIDSQQKNLIRIDALNRLLQELEQIREDTVFLMDKRTGVHMEKIKKKLDEVRDVIKGVTKHTSDTRTKRRTIEINENHFTNCLNVLRDVLSDLKKPLNMKNLIFPASDDFNLEEIKREIIEGG